MNTKNFNLMQNPSTGQQALDIIPTLLGHAGAAMAGGGLAGIPGAIAGLAVPGILSKPIVNLLTNPLTRKSLVDAMIKNKSWHPRNSSIIQSGLQGLNKQG